MPAKALRLAEHARAPEPGALIVGEKKWLPLDVVMAELEASYDHVLGLVRTSQLLAVNISLKPNAKRATWRVSRASLEEFLARRSVKPAEPKPPRRRAKKDGPATVEFF